MSALMSIFDAVSQALPGGITSGFGAERLNRAESYPRIVWVPTIETFSIARGGGTENGLNPRPLSVRQASIDVHIWGRDQDDVEDNLLPQFVNTLQALFYGSYKLDRAMWMNVDGEIIKAGIVYVLTLTMFVPICRLEPQVVMGNVGPLPISGELDALNGSSELSPP